MRRGVLFLMVVIGVCLAFGLSASSSRRLGAATVTPRAAAPVATATPVPIGPGFGGRYFSPGVPAQFLGVTTQQFPSGVGALVASRACNEQYPISRLCEWADVFRALPPVELDQEVLVAPNYETRPVPMCLNPGGGLACNRSVVMRPAACCGFPLPPPPPSPVSITLTPAAPQTLSACTDTFQFTATAYDAQGAPMAGIPLVFEVPPVVGGTQGLNGTFNPTSGISDGGGQVITTLVLFESSCQFNCAGTDRDCSFAIQAHDLGRTVFSNSVTLVDAIP